MRLEHAQQHTWADPWQSTDEASPHKPDQSYPWLSSNKEHSQETDHAMLVRTRPETALLEKSALLHPPHPSPGKMMSVFAGESWSPPELGLPCVLLFGCAHRNTGKSQQTHKLKQVSILDVMASPSFLLFVVWFCCYNPLWQRQWRQSHLQAVSSAVVMSKHENDCSCSRVIPGDPWLQQACCWMHRSLKLMQRRWWRNENCSRLKQQS